MGAIFSEPRYGLPSPQRHRRAISTYPNSGELGRHKVDLSRDQAFSWLEDKMDDLKGGIKNQLTQDIGMMQQQVCL